MARPIAQRGRPLRGLEPGLGGAGLGGGCPVEECPTGCLARLRAVEGVQLLIAWESPIRWVSYRCCPIGAAKGVRASVGWRLVVDRPRALPGHAKDPFTSQVGLG